MQAFVDAYNKLKTLIDGLASPGNPEKNIAAGIFAHDSGLNALRSSMGNALRLSVDGDIAGVVRHHGPARWHASA